jgi:hypothetical protein
MFLIYLNLPAALGPGVYSASNRNEYQNNNSVALVRLSAKLVPTFADRGCYMVSATDPYGRILIFLDRSRY